MAVVSAGCVSCVVNSCSTFNKAELRQFFDFEMSQSFSGKSLETQGINEIALSRVVIC